MVIFSLILLWCSFMHYKYALFGLPVLIYHFWVLLILFLIIYQDILNLRDTIGISLLQRYAHARTSYKYLMYSNNNSLQSSPYIVPEKVCKKLTVWVSYQAGEKFVQRCGFYIRLMSSLHNMDTSITLVMKMCDLQMW